MGKYKVEIFYTVTRTKVFEVEDANHHDDAISKAIEQACDFDFNQISGEGEYCGSVIEAPKNDYTCENCGGELVLVSDGIKCCKRCGNEYIF